jgi:hypothetical protein
MTHKINDMEQAGNQSSEMFRCKRKMLLVMPLIVAPLLALAFHALDGGKGTAGRVVVSSVKGLNMSLPDARFDPKKKALNKLGVYKQADEDSVRLVERRKQDPYYAGGRTGQGPVRGSGFGSNARAGWFSGTRRDTGLLARPGGVGVGGWKPVGGGLAGLGNGVGHADEQADELLKKLDLLKGVLNRQAGVSGISGREGLSGGLVAGTGGRLGVGMPLSGDGARAGTGMSAAGARQPGFAVGQSLNGQASGGMAARGAIGSDSYTGARMPAVVQGDPDLEKLNGMLDKILRIKYPDRGDTVAPSRDGRPVAQLTGAQKEEVIHTLPVAEGSGSDKGLNKRLVSGVGIPGPGGGQDSGVEVPGTGFMDLDEGPAPDAMVDNGVQAVVAHDQTLVSGEAVELRLSQEALINGVRIPLGTMFSGKAALSGERLQVMVSAIRVGNGVVPVSLEVVDLDGMPGIREPGSINRDVGKESADEAMNTLGVGSFDPSFQGQAAAAGVQAAKALIGRKVRLVRVSLKAGYKVLLRNTKVNR